MAFINNLVLVSSWGLFVLLSLLLAVYALLIMRQTFKLTAIIRTSSTPLVKILVVCYFIFSLGVVVVGVLSLLKITHVI